MRHAIPISGKDSLATALVQTKLNPDLSYEFIYNDTEMELPETYAWLDKIERKLKIKIVRIGKNIEDVIAGEGMLPGHHVRFCTKLSKIFPMRDYFNGSEVTIYIGIRFDEERDGNFPSKNMTIKYPLRECRIDLQGVYSILDAAKLNPPTFFWERLHKAVRERVGKARFDKLVALLPRFVFDRIFSWRSRPNCYFCFYQRRYEWAGLLEHHPKLFERAEALELSMADRRKENFYWIDKGFPLSNIRTKSEEFFNKRVKKVSTMILSMSQPDIFADAFIDGIEIAQKSCGIFCGK